MEWQFLDVERVTDEDLVFIERTAIAFLHCMESGEHSARAWEHPNAPVMGPRQLRKMREKRLQEIREQEEKRLQDMEARIEYLEQQLFKNLF